MEPTAPAGRRPGSADITAVVADDDRAFRDRLVARLRSDDWRVLVVGTAQEALDTCAHDAVEFEQLSRTQAAIAPPPWAEAPAGMPLPSRA